MQLNRVVSKVCTKISSPFSFFGFFHPFLINPIYIYFGLPPKLSLGASKCLLGHRLLAYKRQVSRLKRERATKSQRKGTDMADMDPVARARAIAARLAATAIPNDALGKRKSRWEVRTVIFFSICMAMWRCVRGSALFPVARVGTAACEHCLSPCCVVSIGGMAVSIWRCVDDVLTYACVLWCRYILLLLCCRTMVRIKKDLLSRKRGQNGFTRVDALPFVCGLAGKPRASPSLALRVM